MPVHKLSADNITCPVCGKTMKFDTIHSITGDEDFIDKKPYEIGIPLLHIICGRVGMNCKYYEFTEDEKEIFEGL